MALPLGPLVERRPKRPVMVAMCLVRFLAMASVPVVESLLITCMGVFNPIHATTRPRRTPVDHTAQVLSAWSIGSGLTRDAFQPISAITVCGILLLATPLLPRRQGAADSRTTALSR